MNQSTFAAVARCTGGMEGGKRRCTKKAQKRHPISRHQRSGYTHLSEINLSRRYAHSVVCTHTCFFEINKTFHTSSASSSQIPMSACMYKERSTTRVCQSMLLNTSTAYMYQCTTNNTSLCTPSGPDRSQRQNRQMPRKWRPR